MRSGRWKLLFPHKAKTMIGQPPAHGGMPSKYRPLPVGLELYDLEADIAEAHHLAAEHPYVVGDLQVKADAIRAQLGDTLSRVVGIAARSANTATD